MLDLASWLQTDTYNTEDGSSKVEKLHEVLAVVVPPKHCKVKELVEELVVAVPEDSCRKRARRSARSRWAGKSAVSKRKQGVFTRGWAPKAVSSHFRTEHEFIC